MFQRIVLVAFLALVSRASFAEITATIEVIADETTTIPETAETFVSFHREPTIDRGIIAFVGSGAAGVPGVYSWQAGSVVMVADWGWSTNFSPLTFGNPQVTSDGIIFAANLYLSEPMEGVYRRREDYLTDVVNEWSLYPDIEAAEFSWVAARDEAIYVHVTGREFDSHLFKVVGASTAPVAVASEGNPAPGGGTFIFIAQPVTNGSDVAFLAIVSDPARLALLRGNPAGLSVIAEQGTLLPNGVLEGFGDGPEAWQSYAGSRLAFVANPVGLPNSIYIWENGQIRLAVEGTNTGGDGPLDAIGRVALAENGDLAFVAGSRLFIQRGSERVEVLNTQTEINGKRVSAIEIGPSGLDNNVLTAMVTLDGATASEAILRIPYTASGSDGGSGGGGGGGGAIEPLTALSFLLLAVSRGRRQQPR